MKNYFKTWTLFEKSWLIISVTLLIICSIIWKSPWYGFVASISGMVCVVLVAKGKISNYYWGIVNCIFYAYVAYGWQLYGEVMLNMLYFLPMQFVGFFMWSKRVNKEGNEVEVKSLSNYHKFMMLFCCYIYIRVYQMLLESLGGNLTWIDSTSTVLSVVAMVLMACRYMEQWVLWIIVDVVSVIMWFIVVFDQGSNDIGILIMWSAFLINAIYGYINWIKLHKMQVVK